MAKRPQWMSRNPTFVQHPAQTLRDAAKVIREDAKDYRQEKNKDGAAVATRIANALDRVAGGMTWEEAFELRKEE